MTSTVYNTVVSTSHTTSRATSRNTTTTYATSHATSTSWTTSYTTTYNTTRLTSHSTTTTYSTGWNTSRITLISWNSSVSTSHTTSRSTSKSTTTSYNTSRSTQTSYNSAYTTTWTTSRNTTYVANTAWQTYTGFNTAWTTSWSTMQCLVAGTPVHISTTETRLIEDLTLGTPILTMDGGFNVEDLTTLGSVSTTSVDSTLSNDDILHGSRLTYAIGIYDINNGLLKASSDHHHIAKRNGYWRVFRTNFLKIGDIFWHITDGEIPITSIEVDEVNTYTIFKLDVEPNDTFFANGILTHNAKPPGDCDPCDQFGICYDPSPQCME